MTRYDRSSQWQGVIVAGMAETLDLPALGADVTVPLAEIYRWTPLAPSD